MSVRAIRGAIQIQANSAQSVIAGTQELITEILSANSLTPSDFISIFFTASPDLTAAFPASAARELGFGSVPLICSVEIDVPGALARTIRLMAHVETSLRADEIAHIYLHGAKSLRSDIAQ
jgi:chorismate mutase